MNQVEEKRESIEAAKERAAEEDAKMKGKKQELDSQTEDYERELQDQDESLHRVQVGFMRAQP